MSILFALALFAPATAVALVVMTCLIGKWVFEDKAERVPDPWEEEETRNGQRR